MHVICVFALSSVAIALGFDIPRYDPLEQSEVPSDLGDYSFFSCKGSETDRSCSVDTDEFLAYARVSEVFE